ncbi:B12-binding domain-containing radical SAM protein [Streptomyces caeruleatus]|uniref:Radical SAM protein n=1 Tax=Streptomyces caeruleatus TaxID=661399 RepID=A0A117RHP9_9ACTN|nr:radical SAM protein [Streptomyces caeruleatus]KUN91381.1 radical SAM protein [Streptomyces caeruleatus]
MRICLVIPTNRFDRFFIQVPLDVLTAAGRLRADGHTVTVWDQRLQETPPEGEAPDLLVLSTAIADRAQCYPLDLAPVRVALDRARQHFPAARTMAVGPHGTQLPGATLIELGVEHVAVGESDSATVYGVRALTDGITAPVLYGDLPAPGAVPLTVVGNSPRPYPNLDLNEWALPAYDLVPLERYTAEVIVDGLPQRGPSGMVLAARGCTYGCTFCHLPFGTRMRLNPVDRVLAEVDAQQRGGLRFQFFLDYVFGINKAFYGEICERLKGRDIGWVGQTRAEIVLKTDVRQWAEAGCQGMWLGAESPSVAGTSVHKRVTEQQIRDAVLKLKDAGITPFAFILLGLPDDEACVSDWLVDWASEMPAWFGLNQLFLRPGTPLYDQLAADLNGGTAPATWEEVREVTRRYRERYPADLDGQERRLTALPNYLGNAMAVAG